MEDHVKSVLVTVGTTSFDRLIKEVSLPSIHVILKRLGYKRMVLQYGRGEFTPDIIKDNDFEVEAFRFKDSIHNDIQQASLVISHAGAGSVMETLALGKPLVVIINERLMDNHQLELAQRLAEDDHLLYGTCKELSSMLPEIDTSTRKPYSPGNPLKFSTFMDRFMGVS